MTSPRSSNDVPDPAAAPSGNGTISGRWAVLAMFAFAITAVTALYIYWRLHVGPFVPLQKALAAEFPGSRPLVEGGQRKMHRNTPRIVRITMKIDFDPYADEHRTSELAERIIAFARERFDVSAYDVFELHLFWPEPEKEIRQWSVERNVADLKPAAR